MSISTWTTKSVFFATLILLWVVLALIYYLFGKEFENMQQKHFEQKTTKIHDAFEKKIEQRQKFLYQYLKEILEAKDLLKSLKNGDLDKIDFIVKPYYNSLKRFDESVKILTFRTKEGITIYRAHKPDLFGDVLNKKRTIILETDKYKRSFGGFEVGKLEITYRVTQPIFYKDEYIGNVEIGVNPKDMLKELVSALSVDIGIAAKNKFLEVMLDRDIVYIGEGLFLLEANQKLEDYFSKRYQNSNKYLVDTSIELKNHKSERIGFLILGSDVADEFQKSQEHMQKLFWFIALILSVFYIILYYMFYKATGHFDIKAYDGENSDNSFINPKLVTKALKENSVVPYFQPIVDAGGKVVKYEAFMRIVYVELGVKKVLLPEFFLKEAIKDDLYISLFQNMIRKSLCFFSEREEKISLNFLTDDIFNIYIIQELTKNIEKFNLLKKVVVEIPEALCAKNFSKLLQVAKKLREIDVSISIDDFDGTHLSYSAILAIEPHYIKIKGALVQKVGGEGDKNIGLIVKFAKEHNIKTVAEFVENKEMFELLKKYGIDEFQGYYFGYPQEFTDKEC